MTRSLLLACCLGLASASGAAAPRPNIIVILADDIGEQLDLAASEPGKLAELKALYQAWSDEVDADCRKLGLAPKFPNVPPALKRGK